jgi:hypothetical protein
MADITTQTFVIAGKAYDIPPLSARRIIQFGKIIFGMKDFNPAKLTEDELTEMYRAAWLGIAQGTPELTFEQFLDLPITYAMLVALVEVVGKQAGMEFARPEQPAGTARAANGSLAPTSSPPGGTTLSPMS